MIVLIFASNYNDEGDNDSGRKVTGALTVITIAMAIVTTILTLILLVTVRQINVNSKLNNKL